MITDDGRLRYHIELDPRRGFRHRLRHMVNPMTGIACGLLLGGALFVIAVQSLFGVRPSLLAVLIAVAAVVGYTVALLRARVTAARRRAYQVVLDDGGVTVTDGGGSR